MHFPALVLRCKPKFPATRIVDDCLRECLVWLADKISCTNIAGYRYREFLPSFFGAGFCTSTVRMHLGKLERESHVCFWQLVPDFLLNLSPVRSIGHVDLQGIGR